MRRPLVGLAVLLALGTASSATATGTPATTARTKADRLRSRMALRQEEMLRRWMRPWRIPAVGGAFAPTPGAVSAASGSIRPVVLPGLGADFGVAADVNDAEQIVGWATTPSGRTHPTTWRGGVVTELPLLPADDDGYATAINASGLIVGVSGEKPGDPTETAHAVIWRAGSIEDLGTLPGGSCSRATDVNDSGQVVGCAQTAELGGMSLVFRGFVWQDGTMTMLPPLQPESDTLSTSSCASAINERGEIVGNSAVYELPTDRVTSRAVTWAAGTAVDLGTLSGDPDSLAAGISSNGRIVGRSGSFYPGPDIGHAVTWTGGHIRRLASPPGAFWTIAIGVDGGGAIVGQYAGPAGMYGCLWRGSKITDLLPPGSGDSSGAEAINAHGVAVGWGGTHAVAWRTRG